MQRKFNNNRRHILPHFKMTSATTCRMRPWVLLQKYFYPPSWVWPSPHRTLAVPLCTCWLSLVNKTFLLSWLYYSQTMNNTTNHRQRFPSTNHVLLTQQKPLSHTNRFPGRSCRKSSELPVKIQAEPKHAHFVMLDVQWRKDNNEGVCMLLY